VLNFVLTIENPAQCVKIQLQSMKGIVFETKFTYMR